MAVSKNIRLGQAARKLNVGTDSIIRYLGSKGFALQQSPNTKITPEQYELLSQEFVDAAAEKAQAANLDLSPETADKELIIRATPNPEKTKHTSHPVADSTTTPAASTQPPSREKATTGQSDKRTPFKVVGTLKNFTRSYPRPPKRQKAEAQRPSTSSKQSEQTFSKTQIQEQIKDTLAKLQQNTTGAHGRAKQRKEKQASLAKAQKDHQEPSRVLHVTEFMAAKDLAAMMEVPANDLLAQCVKLGIVASTNQRLDQTAITVLADEFGYEVQFLDTLHPVSPTVPDKPEDLQERAPIIAVMGHVDHGKTALLSYIRKAKTPPKEAGGITQHIGAFEITTATGKRMVFLDTPGHEAFTAMRARGARVADIAIIVIAADDGVMPQTKEAISHAQLAGIPTIIAINKVDKPQANPEKVKEGLSAMNYLVEDWGGKYQCQGISAKTGQGIDELLEKLALEADLLALKANPHKKATGSVIEASLVRGKGHVATVMVQEGTLRKGDILLVGSHYGKSKALFNYQGKPTQQAGPATPVQVLGLDQAPQAGQRFTVVDTAQEASKLAAKRKRILREQYLKTHHTPVTSENIIERIVQQNTTKALNLILKGDVDGSLEALADALSSLTTEHIAVNIIHKALGPISESDVLLAATSKASLIGFQVNSTAKAREAAAKAQTSIVLHKVIYDVLDYVKEQVEEHSKPAVIDVVTASAEVRKTFQITRVGTVAGCYVTQGTFHSYSPIRFVRDGTILHKAVIKKLKRAKEILKEAKAGSECGISVENFNDIQVGDRIEAYEAQPTTTQQQ